MKVFFFYFAFLCTILTVGVYARPISVNAEVTRSVPVGEDGTLLEDEGLVRNPVDILLPDDATTDMGDNTISSHEIESRGYPPLKGNLNRMKLKIPKVFRIKGDIPTAGFKKGVELKGKEIKDAITIAYKGLSGAWWSAIGADTDKQLPKPHEKRDMEVFKCDGANATECGPFDDTPNTTVLEATPTLVERYNILGKSLAEQRAYNAVKGENDGKGYHPSPLADIYEPKPTPAGPVPYHEHYKTKVEELYQTELNRNLDSPYTSN